MLTVRKFRLTIILGLFCVFKPAHASDCGQLLDLSLRVLSWTVPHDGNGQFSVDRKITNPKPYNVDSVEIRIEELINKGLAVPEKELENLKDKVRGVNAENRRFDDKADMFGHHSELLFLEAATEQSTRVELTNETDRSHRHADFVIDGTIVAELKSVSTRLSRNMKIHEASDGSHVHFEDMLMHDPAEARNNWHRFLDQTLPALVDNINRQVFSTRVELEVRRHQNQAELTGFGLIDLHLEGPTPKDVSDTRLATDLQAEVKTRLSRLMKENFYLSNINGLILRVSFSNKVFTLSFTQHQRSDRQVPENVKVQAKRLMEIMSEM